jgi:Tol biopolymer transport system component
LRAVWQRSGDPGERVPWRIILPALVAATGVLITLALFTQRANPLVDTAYVATQPAVRTPLNEIYRMNADGTGQTRLLTRPGHFFWGPAWSPDGKRIAFTMGGEQGPGVLYTANPDGSQAVRLTQEGRGSYLPVWSPDGRQVAFLSQAPSNGNFGEVAVINADGSGEKRLTDNGGWNYGVSWSPDGQGLVFGSRQSGTWQLYTAAADGTDQVLLDTGGGGNAPAWSPDGRRIVFTSDRTGQDNIYVVAVSDSHVQQLTSGASHNDNAVWSPDGTQIAFTSDRAGTSEIYVMQADGSGVRNRTAHPGLDSRVPGWSPDGSQILYTAAVHTPPSDPFDRQSLGIAAILIQSALLSGVLLFIVRRWRLPAGALALVIGLSSLAALALQDHYEFLPGVILTALLAELLYAALLPRPVGTLAARPAPFHLFATLVPALFYVLYLVTVLVTQGLAWTADIAAGVVLLAGVTGLLISFLLLPPGDRSAATTQPAPDSER